MKAGAVDFLPKPFRDQDILESIACALAEDRRLKEQEDELASLRARFETLTRREREVLQLVTSGLLNKQVASQLGLSEITITLHRGRAMRQMEARTLDRKSVVYGTSVSVRVDLGGRGIITKKQP